MFFSISILYIFLYVHFWIRFFFCANEQTQQIETIESRECAERN
jgi:hypothetical protein